MTDSSETRGLPVVASSKFRPVPWSDLLKEGAPVVGWGIEEKPPGSRWYVARGYRGKIHPFKSKREAQAVCDELTRAALASSPDGGKSCSD